MKMDIRFIRVQLNNYFYNNFDGLTNEQRLFFSDILKQIDALLDKDFDF